MTKEELLKEIDSLPFEAQQQVEDLVYALRGQYTASVQPHNDLPPLASEAFIGMWRDRDQMADSSAWVRSLRETHWGGR